MRPDPGCGPCGALEREHRVLHDLPHDDSRAEGQCRRRRTATSTAASATSAPGVVGFVKAKWGGTKELYSLVTDTYPRPIHADRATVARRRGHVHGVPLRGVPDRVRGPDAAHPAARVQERREQHGGDRGARAAGQLRRSGPRPRTRPRSAACTGTWSRTSPTCAPRTPTGDRPGRVDAGPTGRSTSTSGPRSSGWPSNVAPDIARLTKDATWQTMDCIDCHNRVGHETPSAGASRSTPRSPRARSTRACRTSGATPWPCSAASYDSTEQANATFDAYAAEFNAKYPLENAKQQHAARRLHRRAQGRLRADRHTRHGGLGDHLREQPGPPVEPRLLPVPRRRALRGRQRQDHGSHDLDCLLDLPHVPAVRARRLRAARGRGAGHARRHPVGLQPQEQGVELEPGQHHRARRATRATTARTATAPGRRRSATTR